ncbi:sulfatase [Telluribacter sp.]|jgi:arylsulfatase A-like enzyme|uniref:sulfatase family protein n=1 Tax=Telluribacter sp. TaxID=1978767 RepID=UPI002E126337|nr:sulfatase [Telluribacter sp.]
MRTFCLIALLTLVSAVVTFAQTKPNILWITIEDTSPQFIGCYKNKNARTPVIDQLAREGVQFRNAFSTGTVCSPSRFTLITGIRTYEAGTGNHRSNYPLPAYMRGFPYYMQKCGYYTTNNSKTDYNLAEPKKFTEEAWSESSNRAGWWNRKPGQPFFAIFNFEDSHQSRTMTDTYEQYKKKVLDELPANERIGEHEFDMPPFYRDSPEMRKQFARVYNSIKLTDNKIGKLLQRLDKDGLRDSTIIFFFADHGEGIPRGKTNGINLGYRVPFIVWFPPMYKHLSPWGEGGVVTDELINFEDLAPTLISLSGGDLPIHLKGRILMGRKRSAPVDHLILSSDRSDNGIDMIRSVTNGRYIYSRNYMPYMPEVRYIRYMEIGDIKQQMRQDLAQHKLNHLQKELFAKRPAEVLYDLKNDGWETTNLINNPAYRGIAGQMRKRLNASLLKSRDVHFLPEYEIAEISKTTTPYEFRMRDEDFPAADVYKAASLAGIRSEAVAYRQIRWLKNKNKFVRYWAAVGLRSQDKATLFSYRAELTAAIQDTYGPVAVMSSAIAYEVFGLPQAEASLKAFCASDNTELALMALNELLYVTSKQPFIENVRSIHQVFIRKNAANQSVYKVKAACMDFLGSLSLVPNNPDYAE